MAVPPEPDDLDRKLDEPRAETFRFKARGDTVKGTVVRLEQATTEYGPARIVVLDTGTELRSVWLIHDALTSQMKKLRPKRGDRVAIRYNGKETSAAGRSYHSYTVVSDREPDGFSWDDEPDAQPGRQAAAGEADDPWRGERNPFDGDPSPDEPSF